MLPRANANAMSRAVGVAAVIDRGKEIVNLLLEINPPREAGVLGVMEERYIPLFTLCV